jgi:hypothetical protein
VGRLLSHLSVKGAAGSRPMFYQKTAGAASKFWIFVKVSRSFTKNGWRSQQILVY